MVQTNGDPTMLEAAAVGGTLAALIGWAEDHYVSPLDIILCEESTFSEQGGVVTRYWFEVKQ